MPTIKSFLFLVVLAGFLHIQFTAAQDAPAEPAKEPTDGQQKPEDKKVDPEEIAKDSGIPCSYFALGDPNNCTADTTPPPKDLRLDNLQMVFLTTQDLVYTEAACDFSTLADDQKPTVAKIDQTEQEHPEFGCTGDPPSECGYIDWTNIYVNCTAPQTFCEKTLGGKYVKPDPSGPCK